jgi:hypothetical protein
MNTMNAILEDRELRTLLTTEQLHLLVKVREHALRMPCRTINDSLAMTAANLLPLFLKERGMKWMKGEVERIISLLAHNPYDEIPLALEKDSIRKAAHEFLQSF